MPDYSLTAEIKGNSSGFNKAAKEAEDATKDLEKQVVKSSEATDKAGDSASKTGGKMKDLANKTKGAGNQAKDAASKFGDLANKIDGAAGKIQKVSGLMLGGLASGFGAAAVSGIQFNAQMEQYATTFEVFTKSAEKADAILEELQKKGAETPFEFTDLADATQKMMAFGFTADEALANLDMLGNAAQGDAEKLETITTAFARMTSSGKVTLEDLNMMIDVGFNPLQQVANDTGTTMGEVYEQISDGALDVETVTKAMKEMTSEGGQYAGLMEKQSQTLNGMLSTLSDTVQMKLGDAFASLTEKVKGALPMIIDFVENIDVDKAIAGIGALAAALAGVFTAATAARGAIALFNAVTAVQKAGGMAAMVSNLGASFAGIVTTIAPVVAAIAGIIAVIALVSTAISQLLDENELFAESVTNIVYSIMDIVESLWNNFLGPIFDSLIEALNTIWKNGIKPLWDSFKQFIADLTIKFSELLDAVYPVVMWFSETFGPILAEIFGTVARAFGNTVSTILSFAGSLLDSIGQIIGGVIDVFKGIINFLTGLFTGNWQKAWQGIVDIFGGIVGTLTGIFKAPINGVIGIINGLIGAINSISIDIPDWVPVVGGQHFGTNIPLIPYLLHGTDDWSGGFARINEGGRGELVYMPDGTQVIPHDISVTYAKEAARLNASYDPIDLSESLDGVTIQIDNSVRVGTRTIREDIADYTIKKIGNTYRATLATKGVR